MFSDGAKPLESVNRVVALPLILLVLLVDSLIFLVEAGLQVGLGVIHGLPVGGKRQVNRLRALLKLHLMLLFEQVYHLLLGVLLRVLPRRLAVGLAPYHNSCTAAGVITLS